MIYGVFGFEVPYELAFLGVFMILSTLAIVVAIMGASYLIVRALEDAKKANEAESP